MTTIMITSAALSGVAMAVNKLRKRFQSKEFLLLPMLLMFALDGVILFALNDYFIKKELAIGIALATCFRAFIFLKDLEL